MKKIFAKHLRSQSTDAESVLWYHLRNRRFLGYKFRRQMPIHNYIVDFVCIEKQLIIELDGGQHVENVIYDEERTRTLNAVGYTVLRFWNNEVFNNIFGVLQYIESHLTNCSPSPSRAMRGRPLPLER